MAVPRLPPAVNYAHGDSHNRIRTVLLTQHRCPINGQLSGYPGINFICTSNLLLRHNCHLTSLFLCNTTLLHNITIFSYFTQLNSRMRKFLYFPYFYSAHCDTYRSWGELIIETWRNKTYELRMDHVTSANFYFISINLYYCWSEKSSTART
jgi:hypothetical protein